MSTNDQLLCSAARVTQNIRYEGAVRRDIYWHYSVAVSYAQQVGQLSQTNRAAVGVN